MSLEHSDLSSGNTATEEVIPTCLDLKDPNTYHLIGIISDIRPIEQNSLRLDQDLAHRLGFDLADEILLQESVEGRFSIRISPDQSTELKTIGDWLACIKKLTQLTIATEEAQPDVADLIK
jgi:hypothetical protein